MSVICVYTVKRCIFTYYVQHISCHIVVYYAYVVVKCILYYDIYTYFMYVDYFSRQVAKDALIYGYTATFDPKKTSDNIALSCGNHCIMKASVHMQYVISDYSACQVLMRFVGVFAILVYTVYVSMCCILLLYTFFALHVLAKYLCCMSTPMIRSQLITYVTLVYTYICIGRSRPVLHQSECSAGDDGGVCVLRVLDYRLVWVYICIMCSIYSINIINCLKLYIPSSALYSTAYVLYCSV